MIRPINTTWECEVVQAAASPFEPRKDAGLCGFEQLELNRPPRFLLDDHSAIANPRAWRTAVVASTSMMTACFGRCRRSNGTTGLIVGAAGGALIGRAIDTRGERTTGTVVGAVAGGLLGRHVERSRRVRCR